MAATSPTTLETSLLPKLDIQHKADELYEKTFPFLKRFLFGDIVPVYLVVGQPSSKTHV